MYFYVYHIVFKTNLAWTPCYFCSHLNMNKQVSYFSFLQTAFYLLCDEWEELLHKGGWEPEAVVKKLPDFLRFVKKVQSFVICEMKQKGLSPTSKQNLSLYRHYWLVGCVIDGRATTQLLPLLKRRKFESRVWFLHRNPFMLSPQTVSSLVIRVITKPTPSNIMPFPLRVAALARFIYQPSSYC